MEIPGFFMLHMGKIKDTKIFNIRPLFGHFWENSAKILLQICAAAYIFTRPLLSYVAEELASWEHFKTGWRCSWIGKL